MNIGQMVLLIDTDGYMPPLGTIGTIIEPIDSDDDYGVSFPSHPCPHPPGPHWYAHKAWLVPLDSKEMKQAVTVTVDEKEKGE